MKKFLVCLLSLVLSICLLLGLSACADNPNDGDNNGGETTPPATEDKIAVKAYIDGELYETIYTSKSDNYKIIVPTVLDDITTNPNSEKYFYGWFTDSNFQTPVTDKTMFKKDSYIYGTWIDLHLNNFKYTVNQGKATITGFNNDTATMVVVPCYLNSFPVTTISYGAFADKTMIRTLIVCDGIEVIEKDAFKNCNSIEKISLPDSLIEIGGFSNCSMLTNIDIPDSVIKIGISAFYDCDGLTTIKIPEGVTSIEYSAFKSCSSLVSINIPNGVTRIESSAFESCTSLESIRIPEGVTSIGSYAFSECDALSSIFIPKSVNNIGEFAFSSCGIQEVIFDDSDITELKRGTFSGCEKLNNVVLPNSLEIIREVPVGSLLAEGVFADCSSLLTLELPDTLSYIGNGAFYRSGLTNIVIPNNIKEISDSTFRKCYFLTSVVIPDSVINIRDSAFEDCYALNNVKLPNNGLKIGKLSFCGCWSLTKIIIPENISSIASYAFYNCYNLVEVYNKSNWTFVIGKPDYGCITLYAKHLYTNENEQSWITETKDGYQFFYDGTTGYLLNYSGKETSLTLPSEFIAYNGQIINQYAIYHYAFSYKTLTDVVIPDSVTSIGYNAFAYCNKLTSVTIGNSVTSIGHNAFAYCNKLTSVTIGNGVKEISDYAFVNSNNLTSVTFKNPYGWFYTSNDAAESGTNISPTELSNPSTAALYLKDKYAGYYWKRK